MKHWQETRGILQRLAELHRDGHAAALASVVQIAGSAYRRPGAKFLIADHGSTLGGVSGGCLEEDVRRTGLQIIASGGECRLLHYETGEDEDAVWGLGLGCNGEVDIFLQPTGAARFREAADIVRGLLDGVEPFAVVTVLASGDPALSPGDVLVVTEGSIRAGASGADGIDRELLAMAQAGITRRSSGTAEIAAGGAGWVQAFVDVFQPPPFVVVIGASDDAIPMIAAASNVGFRVVVVDHRPAYLTERRFPSAWRLIHASPDPEAATRGPIEGLPTGEETFVILKTHNLARDKAWARHFVRSAVSYIGLLGPRARCEEIAETVPDDDRARIYGPVGLDLGAEGPEQVGVAVVSELLAVRSRRRPVHLRDRQVSIHA